MEKQRTQWRGETWYLYRDYFRNRKGKLLHRELYQSVHGPIGLEFDIHHVDGDKANNAIDNLVAIRRGDHLREHGPRGFQLWDAEQRRQNTSQNVWAKRQPVDKVCKCCGVAFQTIGMRAVYCGNNCKSKAFRANNPGYYAGRNRKRGAAT